jgi:hypothetical protein
MTTIEKTTTTIEPPRDDFVIDDTQLAAVAFLARYSGRTLDAYRHDLRGYFQWAADNQLTVLAATRPHIELFRSWMEERGLAASTIDRRLSTLCGSYRFAHIDGRIGSNPAQYVRRPQCTHPTPAASTAPSSARSCFTAEQYDRDHAALAASGPVSVPCILRCCGRRSSWPPLMPVSLLRDVQIAARHADPRTTTIYDRRRQTFDRHAAYVVVAFVAGG